MTGETHQARHRLILNCLDEAGADYLRYHPDRRLDVVTFQQVVDWAAGQAQQPTEPDPGNGVHHNGAQFAASADESAREGSVTDRQTEAADQSDGDDR